MPEDKRMLFIRNKEALENPKVKSHTTEYEVIADAHTEGYFTYEPYHFTIWEFSFKKMGEQKKLCLRTRVKEFSEDYIPNHSLKESGYYHGGGIPDEFISLASLFLRRRLTLGPVVRIDDEPKYFPNWK